MRRESNSHLLFTDHPCFSALPTAMQRRELLARRNSVLEEVAEQAEQLEVRREAERMAGQAGLDRARSTGGPCSGGVFSRGCNPEGNVHICRGPVTEHPSDTQAHQAECNRQAALARLRCACVCASAHVDICAVEAWLLRQCLLSLPSAKQQRSASSKAPDTTTPEPSRLHRPSLQADAGAQGARGPPAGSTRVVRERPWRP